MPEDPVLLPVREPQVEIDAIVVRRCREIRGRVPLEHTRRVHRLQLRRAECLTLAGDDPAKANELFRDAAGLFEEALGFKETDFPAEGPGARPLFAALIATERDAAVRARARLARVEGEAPAVEPVAPEELDRRWKELSAEIDTFRAELAGGVAAEGAR